VFVDVRNKESGRGEDQFRVVVKVELEHSLITMINRQKHGKDYLKDIMAQLEDDNMLHPQVLLHPFHTLFSAGILECVVVFAVKSIHDVFLEVF